MARSWAIESGEKVWDESSCADLDEMLMFRIIGQNVLWRVSLYRDGVLFSCAEREGSLWEHMVSMTSVDAIVCASYNAECVANLASENFWIA